MTMGGDALAPLLPEHRQEARPSTTDGGNERKAASVPSAVFNLSTSIIGAGIMSLPAAVKILGVVPAIVLVAAAAYLADTSAEFLLHYAGPGGGGEFSYAAAMGRAFGRVGSVALQLCIALTVTGTLTVYFVIIGDVLSGSQSADKVHPGMLQEWFGDRWWTARAAVLLVTLVFVILPLVLLRRLDSLRFTSAISILLAVVFMLISSAMALYALFQGKTENPRLVPDFDHLSSFLDLFTAAPVIVFAFTFHFNVHPIRSELSKTSDMTAAVRMSVLLCSAIYAATGFFGYLLFGESTMADILSNFDRDSDSPIGRVLNDVVRLSYVLHLVLVFPLLFFSLRINIDELLFPKSKQLTMDTCRFGLLTACLLAFIYLTSILLPSVWAQFQLFGSTTAVCISLIFPAAIVLRDVEGISKTKDKVLASVMIAVAVVTSSIAITSNIISYSRNLNSLQVNLKL